MTRSHPEITPESVTAFFEMIGLPGRKISKVSEKQYEIAPGRWGWWVYSDNQRPHLTDYFERHYGQHPGYNNAVAVNSYDRHSPGTLAKPVSMSLAVES